MDPTVPITIALAAGLFLVLGAILDDRRARVRRREQAVGLDIETVVPLLHSINDDRCIGCEACIDVCPTEVLDLINHKVRVSRFTDCVQCEQCANVCPTMALVMYREGTTPRMLTVPELDENFQTGVQGQYLIGEVAGKPLVKNAANLGRAVIEHIVKELAVEAKPPGDVLDVVVVGSGPAGLSAGLTCLKHQLSCMVLEKEQVISSTVARYPKGKHFMAEPVDSLNVSFLPVFDASKEELVAAWQRLVTEVQLPVKLGESVETVKRGDDGIFVIKTTVATYRARRVVLSTGLRGKPRLLAVPGANLEKVESLLDDPAAFAEQHVLVVGGGDSAVEGAMSLASIGATVTLSYRGDGFKRCKQGNQKRLADMQASNALSVLLESNITEFTPDKVSIKLKDGTVTTIPNQHAFVLIGADTPVVWLEANNVRFIERPHLYALGSTEAVVRRVVPDAVECPRSVEDAVAVLKGKPAHAPRSRVKSMVGHIRDEFSDVVSSMSQAFRLSDLQPPPRRRGEARTPVTGTAHVVRRAATVGAATVAAPKRESSTRVAPSRMTGSVTFVPAARLNWEEHTVLTKTPFGDSVSERTTTGGTALRPRARHGGTGTGNRALPPRPAPQPRDELKVRKRAIERDLDSAFDRAFGEPNEPAGKPNEPAAKPIASGARPIASRSRPIASGAKPIASGAKPIASGAKPIAKAGTRPLANTVAKPAATSAPTPAIDGDTVLSEKTAEKRNPFDDDNSTVVHEHDRLR